MTLDPSAQLYKRFQSIANIILGMMVGLLIALPLAGTTENRILTPLAILAGLLTGYRRRHSRLFMYFCMCAIVVLSALISFYSNGN